MPNKFTSPANIPYLNINEQQVGYINTATKAFYLSDSFYRSATSEESNKQQDTLLSFVKSSEPAFDLSNWKAFSIRYLMSDDEYTVDFEESVTADLSAWKQQVEEKLYRRYTGAFDEMTKPENIKPAALCSKAYGFGNLFSYFANKVGKETSSSQQDVSSTPAKQQTSEKKFGK